MLSRFVEVGSKVELRALEHGLGESGAENTTKVYQSRVLQILSEDTLEISMPMEQTRLILLPVESEYDMVFFEENSLYQCFSRIVDRYKSNNVYGFDHNADSYYYFNMHYCGFVCECKAFDEIYFRSDQ